MTSYQCLSKVSPQSSYKQVISKVSVDDPLALQFLNDSRSLRAGKHWKWNNYLQWKQGN